MGEMRKRSERRRGQQQLYCNLCCTGWCSGQQDGGKKVVSLWSDGRHLYKYCLWQLAIATGNWQLNTLNKEGSRVKAFLQDTYCLERMIDPHNMFINTRFQDSYYNIII